MLLQIKSPRRVAPQSIAASSRITYARFLKMNLPSPHVEWVDGKIIPMPPISATHNDLGLFFLALLQVWVQVHDAGELKYEPFQMKTGPDLPGRSPDILFVAKENLSRLKKNYLEGPADLVIEIASPKTRNIDRRAKFQEYEKGGVREYWLIDDPPAGRVLCAGP